jgi:putative endonuclease
VLYIGFTNNLAERLYWHRNPEAIETHFTARYKCFFLLYYEHFQEAETAIQREKQLKGYSRIKKEKLITAFNPGWRFLNDEV